MLVSTTRCVKGLWTGRPNLGFWCNEEKAGVKGENLEDNDFMAYVDSFSVKSTLFTFITTKVLISAILHRCDWCGGSDRTPSITRWRLCVSIISRKEIIVN